MNGLMRDLRYAMRTLRRTPGFTAVAVLTLALGIGANAAVFSVINGVLLQPLPYPEPERIVRVLHEAPEDGFAVRRGAFSPQDFQDLRDGSEAYDALAAYMEGNLVFTGSGEPEEISGAFVSADFFKVLGVPPQAGRVPAAEEHIEGNDRVAVVSAEFARRRFGETDKLVGRTLLLGGEPFTVTGIMPASFDFPARAIDVWVPLSRIGEDDIPSERDLRWQSVIGHLAPGASLQAAANEANGIVRRLAAAWPESNEGWDRASVITLHDALVGDIRPALLTLFGAVAFVLLIVCANLANLLLARGNARGRELAVRTALGARRSRLARQVLTESMLLALAGGTVGLLLAAWGIDGLLTLAADTIPRPGEIRLDLGVAGFTLIASAVTGVVFGLLPSLTVSRVNLRESLSEGGRGGTAGRARLGMRKALVSAQVALAVVLLIGAGLLLRSFWNLTKVDPGFNDDNVLALSVSTPSEVMDSERRDAYRSELIARIEQLPGVLAVGGGKTVPLQGEGEPYAFRVPGRAEPVTPEMGVFPVTPGYFRALGIPLLLGREFSTADETSEATVVIVNRAFAERYLADRDAVGSSLELFDTAFTIVGVAGDVRHEGIAREPGPAVYLPTSIMPRSSLQLFVRTAGDPVLIANAVRQAVWDINPDQPIAKVAAMRQVLAQTVARPRLFTLLLGLFGGIAIVLAALGIYGVIAYSLSLRTQEFGVRMALGAKGGDLLRLLVTQGLSPVLLGIAAGLLAALGVTRALSSQLYGVGSLDPLTFAGVALLLLAVATLATCLPARRAMRVNPIEALRHE